jgi:hypothetical protein
VLIDLLAIEEEGVEAFVDIPLEEAAFHSLGIPLEVALTVPS